MRTLAGTLCSVSLFATFAAEATLIERSVELDLLQLDLPSRSFEATLDFDDATLEFGDRLALDIHFVNGEMGVFRDPDPSVYEFLFFVLVLQGSHPDLSAIGPKTVNLLGITGDLRSDTLVPFESPFSYAFPQTDGSEQRASFTYSGLRYEQQFPFMSGTVSALSLRQWFFAPDRRSGDSTYYRVPESVPEPGTLSLLGAGLLSLILARRRRRITG